MIDTHCHFEIEDKNAFQKELQEIKESGVSKIIVSCCTKKEQQENLPLLKNQENVYLALGYHPEEANQTTDKDIQELKEKIKETPSCVAIGEIGLDYHYTKENKQEQQKLFEQQLSLAKGLNLPVVIHSRDATEDTINILKKYPVKGVIHCFTGSLETAKIYIQMGFLLGIGGVITFKNSHLKEVVKEIPLSSIVLETDSPYLAPHPYRGKKNSPKYLKEIAETIKNVKNIDILEVQEITDKNAIETFDLL